MKILISSLQVSEDGSKGHLHPALEIGLELKSRGHHVGILPIPGNFNLNDQALVTKCGFEIISPPLLPQGILHSRNQLAQFAKHPETTHQAYHSFLVAPLKYQFDAVIQKIKNFQPDVVVYDLLVYAAPMAARLLNIPDIGYCAGLKLIAAPEFTAIYQLVSKKIFPSIENFFKIYGLISEFHQLELLSNTYQLVFTPKSWLHVNHILPRRTLLVGSLPISEKRIKNLEIECKESENFIVLCFGSALDPANYPEMTKIIIKMAELFQQKLMISSNKRELIVAGNDVVIQSYLPLPRLLKKANILIHHGGANIFSESLTLGTPQILIPLTTDQPIQAEFLKNSGAGLVIYPNEISEKKLYDAFEILLDKNHPIHKDRLKVKEYFSNSHGAIHAADLIEKAATSLVSA